MGLMWFSVGALAVGAVWGMIELSKRHELSPLAWVGALGGMGLVLFGIAWAGSSFHEGVPASSAMGLMVFCGPGIVAMTLAWRFWVAPGLRGD